MIINALFIIYLTAFVLTAVARSRFYSYLQRDEPDLWRRIGAPDMQPKWDLQPLVRSWKATWRNHHRSSPSAGIRFGGEWVKWTHPILILMFVGFAAYFILGAVLVSL